LIPCDRPFLIPSDCPFLIPCDRPGNQEWTITGNQEWTITGNQEWTITGNQEWTITGNQEWTITGVVIHLLMLSVSIASTVASSNPAHDEMYGRILCDKACQWLGAGHRLKKIPLCGHANAFYMRVMHDIHKTEIIKNIYFVF
jgi:hypothetical protein